jgi:hypothetical protein
MPPLGDWLRGRARYTPLPTGPAEDHADARWFQSDQFRRRVRAALIALTFFMLGLVAVTFL